MIGTLHWIDWVVIITYLLGLIGFALWLARDQADRADYYVAGRQLGHWPIALSIMATQCSTNSILGAPAFVAFAAGGGLVWLQYELALPLAMIVLMYCFIPTFRRRQLVSIYEYLEQRFDRKTRLTLSALFLFVRAFATAVTVYSIAIVIKLIMGVDFFTAVLLLGFFTVVYDCIGGIKGVVYSDVLQLGILSGVLVLVLILLTRDNGGWTSMLSAVHPDRLRALDFSHHGFGDGHNFAFWPMLFGGFFLYVSYYGCDQSQVQRELCAKDTLATNRTLLLNGLLRFPLVALYCFVGIGIAAHAIQNPDFIATLPLVDSEPNYNLAVPAYILNELPTGLIGLALVALFAAAMSSLDSVLNALSATTMEDWIRPRLLDCPKTRELWIARSITFAWGGITMLMAFFVDDIATTVLEAINKIGSLANGPILAVFCLGLFYRKCGGTQAIVALVLGIATNACLWLFTPQISWLWWNVIGFAVSVGTGIFASLGQAAPRAAYHESAMDNNTRVKTRIFAGTLLLWFAGLVCFLSWFH